jgi:hypothetical protein
MNEYILGYERIRLINRVLQNHDNVFEKKPAALALRDELQQRSDEVAESIATLLLPMKIIRKPRQVSHVKLQASLSEFTKLGIAVALKKEDEILANQMKIYKRSIYSTSSFKLLETARQVMAILTQFQSDATEFGITSEKLSELDALITILASDLVDTHNNLSDRRTERTDLKAKIRICNKIIKEQIDAFVSFSQKEFPDFYTDYTEVRGTTSRSKRGTVADVVCEISGTVTDKATGLPVENAIINIIGLDMACTTDADGYYLIEDLVEGNYSLTCQAQNYELSAPVAITLQNDLPAQLDFALDTVSQN